MKTKIKRIAQLFFLFDESYIKFRMEEDPVAFNEKLQSIKLFTTLVDKLRERASSYLPFIREDMYYCEGKVLLGEFALYNYDGFIPFNPPENRQKIGELLNIYNIRGK